MTTPKKKVGRPSLWDEFAPEMARLYREEDLSQGEIARRYGTSVQTVGRMLRKQGIEPKPKPQTGPKGPMSEEHKASISASRKGKGTGPRRAREERTCEACKSTFEYRPGKTGERFCSTTCSQTGQSHELHEAALQAYEADPKRCPCGKMIPYIRRYAWKYCSGECRTALGGRRQKDETKWITFDCETCGEKATKRISSGNQNRFCSNACAAKHTKTVRHYVCRESDMVLDSTWEMLFAGLMGFRKIPCERLDRNEAIEWSEGHWYAPDFAVVVDGLRICVEVKGQQDAEDEARWTAWTEQCGPLVVLMEEHLDDLVSCTPREVRSTLYRWATEPTYRLGQD